MPFFPFLAYANHSVGENHVLLNGIVDTRSETEADNDSVFQGARSTSEPNLGESLLCLSVLQKKLLFC